MTNWPAAPDAPKRCGVPSCTCCTSHVMRIPTAALGAGPWVGTGVAQSRGFENFQRRRADHIMLCEGLTRIKCLEGPFDRT